MIESRHLFTTLLNLIPLVLPNEEEDSKMKLAEDDEDDEDDDDQNQMIVLHVLQFLTSLLVEGLNNREMILNLNEMFEVGRQAMQTLLSRLDEDMGDEKYL
jgi:hypothetical protein